MGRTPGNTKDTLINTARELIWGSSYNAVSVDEICKKAGVQKGSFYHYFKSKAHLAIEAMETCKEETRSAYNDIFSPTRSPIERFQLMVQHILDQQREISKDLGHVCGCPFATLGSELASQDPDIHDTIQNAITQKSAYYESALRDMVAAGMIDAETNITLKANDIFSFIVGQLMMARIKNDLSFLENGLETSLFDLIGLNEATKIETKNNKKLTN